MPNVLNRRIKENKLGDVLLNEFEIWIAAKMRDVIDTASNEIIDPDHLVTAREKQIGQMGPEKTGRPGDDGGGMTPHYFAPAPVNTTGTVNHRIFRSSQMDQLSMYSGSSRTHSRKSEM